VVPVGHAPALDVPVGHHVVAPLQYAIQRTCVGHQAFARVGVDQAFHQLVNGRVFEAHAVAAARFVGGGAHPVLALLVARRVGLRKTADHHVEVPRAYAVDVLRDVDAADD